MKNPIIDKQTGIFNFNDGFRILKGTTEAEIATFFDLDDTIEQRAVRYGLTYYTAQNVETNGFYFNLVFTFKDRLLECLQFEVSADSFSLPPQAHSQDGWNYSDEEKQRLIDYELWLTQQLGNDRIFQWGKINAMWQPLGNGPIIYLEYS